MQDNTASELYRNRAEWKDVQPIYNTADEEAIVRIALNEDFIDAFAYLRSVMNSGETSERAFKLTETCIKMNAANYSVWEYRRRLLKALKKDLSEELAYIEDVIAENMKNYQVWHHRREIVSWMKPEKVNLKFIDDILKEDPKNYHAWQHRVHFVNKYKVDLVQELKKCTDYIVSDAFNNSAWTYRYFIVQTMTNGFQDLSMLKDEITFTIGVISHTPNNSSPWSYLMGMMDFTTFSSHPDVVEFAKTMLDSKSPQGLKFLADAMAILIEEKKADAECLSTAKKCYEQLIVIDPIRRRYYNYKYRELLNMHASVACE